MNSKQSVPCPQCGGAVDMTANNLYRPFCSRRCKLLDLGGWLDESNRISDPEGTAGPPSPHAPDYGEEGPTH